MLRILDCLPDGVDDLSGMNLSPSLWVGGVVAAQFMDISDTKSVIQPGDMVQIVGVDGDGGIYVQAEEGFFIGPVAAQDITPWRR